MSFRRRLGSSRGEAMNSPNAPLPQRYVRVLRVRGGRFVEFEFSIGDDDLTVELILPLAAFEEFRATQKAVLLPPDPETARSLEQSAWRAGQPGLLRRVKGAIDTDEADNPKGAAKD